MCSVISVEADSIEEAMEIAKDDDGVIPIPDNGTFIDGSWQLDCYDPDAIMQCYNTFYKGE